MRKANKNLYLVRTLTASGNKSASTEKEAQKSASEKSDSSNGAQHA